MRAASTALINLINAVRAETDAELLFADCFTITLAQTTSLDYGLASVAANEFEDDGLASDPVTSSVDYELASEPIDQIVLRYTNFDVPIELNGETFVANSILIDGLKFKCTNRLDIDQQKITISAKPTDTVNGVPFLVGIAQGMLDGAIIQRERAFLSSINEAAVGSVILFKGRVGKVDGVGRTTAEVTVNSDLVFLDLNMPRNLYQPACLHVLYDSGCTLNRADFATAGSVGAGATYSLIPWSGASANFVQGRIIFTSGLNANLSATVKSVNPGISLTLIYPLPQLPEFGDAFTVYFGCDHTQATCLSKFNNLPNFRGFPYVPPPTYTA